MPTDVTLDKIDSLIRRALGSLESVVGVDGLERWRVEYLGRNGHLTYLLRGIADISQDERGKIGAAANSAKKYLTEAMNEKRSDIVAFAEQPDGIDVTLPGRMPHMGRLHPSTKIIYEILAAFNDMGFSTVEGPEIELERYNFDLLNIPPEHPARDQWDTIWVKSARRDVLLRTHTSPMQARVMEKGKLPIRIVVPGKCYRYESTDATHEWQFHQVEGLAVDEGITFAHLKTTLYEFSRRMFGAERRIRFRCDFFPFVEPGVDMSVDCFVCSGSGCSVCRQSGWIEILGAGMVHPNVLREGGFDPEKVTGFAFGMGPERIGMLRYGVDDIRRFLANDLRFLSQFPV